MKRAIAVLLPALLLVGCAAQSAEGAYLSTLRASIPALREVPDADLIDLGKNLCELLDAGGYYDGMAEFIEQAESSGLNADNTGDIARAAITAYCPEYSDAS